MPDATSDLLAALRALGASGCHVGGQDEPTHARMVDLALRRWQSSSRRGVPQDDRAARERDLLEGLLSGFDVDPRDIGPEVRDRECVVHALLPHLDADG